MKKDQRGKFWKSIPKEERTKIMSKVVQSRWDKTTPKERTKWSEEMNEKRWKKTP